MSLSQATIPALSLLQYCHTYPSAAGTGHRRFLISTIIFRSYKALPGMPEHRESGHGMIADTWKPVGQFSQASCHSMRRHYNKKRRRKQFIDDCARGHSEILAALAL